MARCAGSADDRHSSSLCGLAQSLAVWPDSAWMHGFGRVPRLCRSIAAGHGGRRWAAPLPAAVPATQCWLRPLSAATHLSWLQVYFIKFFAPWCGHCKVRAPLAARSVLCSRSLFARHIARSPARPPMPCPQRLAPTWEELAKSFADNPKVSIASVDCTEHKDTCTAAEVRLCGVRVVDRAWWSEKMENELWQSASHPETAVRQRSMCEWWHIFRPAHPLRCCRLLRCPTADPGLPHAQGVPRRRGAGRGIQG